jgi:quercetin dioxygenase-like cupin family protein
MELSERYIQKLESEGFANVYEWQDPAGTVYQEHSHQGQVTFYVTDGSITVTIDGETTEVQANERYDVPSDTPHSVEVGSDGWIVIIGEEITGDS